ncbi:CAP domain-containing protein [Streptomyces fradiae]|uniref:CAP domain-containing protein n=1 Tax=Streptomyces fradiae TaxID=1906 RepID=UPI00364994C4
MQHHPHDPHDPRDPQDHPGRPRRDGTGQTETARHGRRRRAKGRGAATASQRRHARRRWTYQGIGTVVAGTVAVAAVAAGTYLLGGPEDGNGSLATRTVAPVPVPLPGDAATGPTTTAPTPTGTPTPRPSASPSPSASTGAAPSGSSAPSPSRSATASPARSAKVPGKRPADGQDAPATREGSTESYRGGTSGTGGTGGTGGGASGDVQRVVELANAERAKAGCPALRIDGLLQKAAQGHADDMAARDFYDHTTPEGRSPGDRIDAVGYRWSTWAENIHRGPADPATAVRDWMKSPGHRANILNCAFRDIGVGVNTRSNGPWWVQKFGASA